MTDHLGLLFGLANFDAEVVIEDVAENIDVSYSYDGDFIDMHLIFKRGQKPVTAALAANICPF